MKRENEIEKQNPRDHSSKDRLDWISKYLELADKMIQAHMPEPPKQTNKS